MDATFRISYLPPAVTLTIEGELDVLNRALLRWRLRDLELAAADVARLDVGRVNYIDHDSLRLIDDTRRRLAERGVGFELVAASLCFTLVSGLGGFPALAAAAEGARQGYAPVA